MLVLTVLIGFAVMSSMKRQLDPSRADAVGACCPLMAAWNRNPIVAATNQVTETATAHHVIAYYFHGTVRCETCLILENLAKGVVEELAENRVMFASLNYDLPENAHFLTDYKLPCPSLVLVRQDIDQEETWRLLGDTWQLVDDPAKLRAYVETEVRAFLSLEEQPTSTKPIGSPPVPDRH